ncbi:MAG: Na+ dependent nucleoside transporter [Coprobacter sp.]|nr:Na+ dependent nucleoside transporter [Coprobacter sp.]
MTIVPAQGISFISAARGLLGIAALLAVAFAVSRDRKHIRWRTVITGLAIQLILAFGILYVPFIQTGFEWAGRAFVKVMDFARSGSDFLFGPLLDTRHAGYIFVFQVLPAIVFFSALTSVLYYLNVIQRVVQALAWCLHKLLGISGAEGLTVAGNVFLGQCEAPLLAKEYLPAMNRSELFLVMTAGMATVSGAVLSAYIGMLGGDDPAGRVLFARYLLSASVMAAPGAVVFAKIIVPQTEKGDSSLQTSPSRGGDNLLDALSGGAVQGVRLAVTVAALLLAFIGTVALLNYLLGGVIGRYTGVNRWLTEMYGRPAELNFQTLTGWLFTPLAWLMGVCKEDMTTVGSLLGIKTILNEFIAYADFNMLKNTGAFVQEKSIVITTFALCGFANIGSVGMLTGGIGVLAPNQRKTLTEYGFRAMLAGMLASCMSGVLVGMIAG